MLDLRPSIFLDENMADANILLLHTVGGVAQVAVSAILVRALYLLRRKGKTPKGFFPIAVLMSIASLARVAHLIYAWAMPQPPYWLDSITVTALFIAIIAIPVILSSSYFPLELSSDQKTSGAFWLQGAMIVNAVCGLLIFVPVLALQQHHLIFLIPCFVCTISAILLYLRTSMLRNFQLRQRGLVLFAGFTTVGLLGISSNLLFGYVGQYLSIRSLGLAASIELSNMLITLGMMCVFASLRLADVIVKQVAGMYIWGIASLSVWGAATGLSSVSLRGTDGDAERAFLAITLIGAGIWLTPLAIQKTNKSIDKWIFQVPDFNSVIQQFWEQLLEFENLDGVYRAGEETIRSTLSLAEVRIIALSEVPLERESIPVIGPNPYFVPEESPLRLIVSPSADILVPLVQEGVADHWIVLSYGGIRPPLTAMELNFISRVAGEIHLRISAVLAEHRRLEKLKRESAFRQEIADAELRALRAQINPHFLFNSLNTIADLSIVAPERAEEMTLRLSSVFRYVLVNTERQFVSVGDELDFARSYLGIEEARFESRLKVQFDVEPDLLEERIPTLLLQPLIENALKHGISAKMQGGTLSIRAKRTNTGFELTVSDDGAGLHPKRDQDTTDRHTRLGLRNVEKRLQTAYDGRAALILKPREGGGTEATVIINKSEVVR